MSEINENKVIQVCSECKKASCWYGEFMCENSYTASTELRTIKELREINAGENEDYWSDEYMTKVYGEANPFGIIGDDVGMETEEIVTIGVIAKSEEDYQKTKIRLQRAISEGGDTVAVSAWDQNNEPTIYIIPTVSLKKLI